LKLSNFLIVSQKGTEIAVLSAVIFRFRHGLVHAEVTEQIAAYLQRCFLSNYHVVKAQGLTGALLCIKEVIDLKLCREPG
jgi:hypothetical protein